MTDPNLPRQPWFKHLPGSKKERKPLGDITEAVREAERRARENAANIEAGNEALEESDDEVQESQPTPTTQPIVPLAGHGQLPIRPAPIRPSQTGANTGTPTPTRTPAGHGSSPARPEPIRPSPLRQSLTMTGTIPASNSNEVPFNRTNSTLAESPTNQPRNARTSARHSPVATRHGTSLFNNPRPFDRSPGSKAQSVSSSPTHPSPLNAVRNRTEHEDSYSATSTGFSRSAQGTPNRRRSNVSSTLSPGRKALQDEVDEGEEDFQHADSIEALRQKQKYRRRRGDDDDDDDDDESMGGGVA